MYLPLVLVSVQVSLKRILGLVYKSGITGLVYKSGIIDLVYKSGITGLVL